MPWEFAGNVGGRFCRGTGIAEGVALSITLSLVDSATCELAGRAVYLWHCDRDGAYSMYAGSALASRAR